MHAPVLDIVSSTPPHIGALSGSPSSMPHLSIVVLPFANLGGDPSKTISSMV